MDAAFLAAETADMPLHTVKVFLLDGDGSPRNLAELKRWLAERLPQLPVLRQRVEAAGFGLAQPRWQPAKPDLNAHVSQVTAAGGGDLRELSELVARAAETHLPRQRPLWHVTWVTGLEGGATAIILRVHHALADGMSTARALEGVFRGVEGREPTVAPARPSFLGELWLALLGLLRFALWLPWLAVASLAQSLRRWRDSAARRREAASVYETPKLSFNQRIDGSRIFAMFDLELNRLKAIKGAAGISFNAAFMTLCCGAVRRYLQQRGELPEQPLVASIPSTLDDRPARAAFGNYVSTHYARLPLHEADPREQARYLEKSMAAAKRNAELGLIDEPSMMNALPPAVLRGAIFVWQRLRPIFLRRPSVNLVLSNVRGPGDRLADDTISVAALYSMGVLPPHSGLNVTAWSYHGRIHVSLMACRRLNPDLWRLADAFPVALDELEEALGTS